MKNIPYNYKTVQLLDGEQHGEEFLKINPMHQVPALQVVMDDGHSDLITQSLAIIEYLEENYPNNSVFPKDSILRAKCRAISETICGGIQPLQNLETLVDYTQPIDLPPLDAANRQKVARFWIGRKMENLEKLVKSTAGNYCVGDTITLADICLVPQMFNARRFELDTSKFPLLEAIDKRLQEHKIFKDSHPLACPEAPKQENK